MMAIMLAIAAVIVLAAAIMVWRLPSLAAVLGNYDLTTSLALLIVGGALMGAAIVQIALR
jgi:multisubunit Na+/H+ antiporter MnhG subunit